MIADPHLDAFLDQRLRDVGLNIRKADHEIRLEIQNAVDLGAGEGRDPRFLAARLLGAHGEAGNADDPILLTECVKHLCRLFGQANDSGRISTVHVTDYSTPSARAAAAPCRTACANPGACGNR